MISDNSTQTEDASEYKEAPIDTLTKKTAHLFSMLVTATGEGFETFNTYNDEIKSNYMWACAELAREIKHLLSHIACNGIREA